MAITSLGNKVEREKLNDLIDRAMVGVIKLMLARVFLKREPTSMHQKHNEQVTYLGTPTQPHHPTAMKFAIERNEIVVACREVLGISPTCARSWALEETGTWSLRSPRGRLDEPDSGYLRHGR